MLPLPKEDAATTIREELHGLVDQLSEEEADATLSYVRQLRQGSDEHPKSARERLAQRMGPPTEPWSTFNVKTPADLAALAAQQGVQPVKQFESLLGHIWPPEEDVDEFIAMLRK